MLIIYEICLPEIKQNLIQTKETLP